MQLIFGQQFARKEIRIFRRPECRATLQTLGLLFFVPNCYMCLIGLSCSRSFQILCWNRRIAFSTSVSCISLQIGLFYLAIILCLDLESGVSNWESSLWNGMLVHLFELLWSTVCDQLLQSPTPPTLYSFGSFLDGFWSWTQTWNNLLLFGCQAYGPLLLLLIPLVVHLSIKFD